MSTRRVWYPFLGNATPSVQAEIRARKVRAANAFPYFNEFRASKQLVTWSRRPPHGSMAGRRVVARGLLRVAEQRSAHQHQRLDRRNLRGARAIGMRCQLREPRQRPSELRGVRAKLRPRGAVQRWSMQLSARFDSVQRYLCRPPEQRPALRRVRYGVRWPVLCERDLSKQLPGDNDGVRFELRDNGDRSSKLWSLQRRVLGRRNVPGVLRVSGGVFGVQWRLRGRPGQWAELRGLR